MKFLEKLFIAFEKKKYYKKWRNFVENDIFPYYLSFIKFFFIPLVFSPFLIRFSFLPSSIPSFFFT